MTTIAILESGEVRDSVHVGQSVFRVGRDQESAVVLDRCEAHVLTVVSREGRTRVINRTDRSVFVEAAELGPAMSQAWLPGQLINLGQDVSLRLIPSPSQSRPRGRTTTTGRRSARAPAQLQPAVAKNCSRAPTTGDKRRIVIITTACIAIMTGLLGFSKPADQVDTRARFEQIMGALSAEDDPMLHYAQSQLRKGREYELRGMQSDASIEFAKAREILRASIDRAGRHGRGGTSQVVQQAVKFAERF